MTDMQGTARPFEKAGLQNKQVKSEQNNRIKKSRINRRKRQKSISLKKQIHSSGNRKRRENAVFPNTENRKDPFLGQTKNNYPRTYHYRVVFLYIKRAVRRKFATYRRNFPFYRICPFSCRKPDKKVYFFIAATCLATSALRSSLFFSRPSPIT